VARRRRRRCTFRSFFNKVITYAYLRMYGAWHGGGGGLGGRE
jgi:hypothetical protein